MSCSSLVLMVTVSGTSCRMLVLWYTGGNPLRRTYKRSATYSNLLRLLVTGGKIFACHPM